MEKKYWLDSTVVQAQLIGVLPAIYAVSRVFGLDLPDGLLEQIVTGVMAVLTLVSLVGSFIGRFKAEKPLTFKK